MLSCNVLPVGSLTRDVQVPGTYLHLWDPLSATVGEQGVNAAALEPGQPSATLPDPCAGRGPRAFCGPHPACLGLCVYTCICVYMDAFVCTDTHVYMHASVYVRVSLCMHTCQSMSLHTHICHACVHVLAGAHSLDWSP